MMRTVEGLAQSALIVSVLLVVLPAFCPAQETDGSKLSPAAIHAARIIGVDTQVARLSSLAASTESGATGMSLEELSLHQQITEAVVVASLDVDFVVDQIDNESAQILELQSIQAARRQRALGTTNLSMLALGTGLGAVSGVLQFSDTTKGVGNAIGFATGGLSTFLSFRSLRQQHSGARPAWALPSMLAPFFGEPQDHSVYPADVWTFLDSTPDGASSLTSKREQLLTGWRSAGRFPDLDSPESKPRLALLTSTDAADKKLNMDLLSERSAMLADVREEVAFMKRALGEILRGIRSSR